MAGFIENIMNYDTKLDQRLEHIHELELGNAFFYTLQETQAEAILDYLKYPKVREVAPEASQKLIASRASQVLHQAIVLDCLDFQPVFSVYGFIQLIEKGGPSCKGGNFNTFGTLVKRLYNLREKRDQVNSNVKELIRCVEAYIEKQALNKVIKEKVIELLMRESADDLDSVDRFVSTHMDIVIRTLWVSDNCGWKMYHMLETGWYKGVVLDIFYNYIDSQNEEVEEYDDEEVDEEVDEEDEEEQEN